MDRYRHDAGGLLCRRADVQAARAEESRVATTAKARRDAIAEEAKFAALQLAQAQRMLEISAKADTVAAKRVDSGPTRGSKKSYAQPPSRRAPRRIR